MADAPLSNQARAVWEAVEALYGSSPARQQAAGPWLNEFLEHAEVPLVALELIRSSHPAEIQFFSANMLLTTIKRRWSRLDPATQQKIQQRLSQELARREGEPGALTHVTRQRLVLAAAAVSTLLGPSALPAALDQALALANQGDSQVSVELLGALAEAANELHRLPKVAALAALEPHADRVFPVVLYLLRDRSGTRTPRMAALRCLLAWLKLDGSGSGDDALMSPGALRKSQKELFDTLLAYIAHPDEEVAAVTTEIIVHLMSSWPAAEDAEMEESALRETAAAVLRLCPATDAGIGSPVLRRAAEIAAALAVRDMLAIADRLPEAVPLAAVVLRALGCGDHAAAEAAIDYFDLLSSVPVARRHPQLGQPVYTSMLPHLSGLASYPPDFTTWEDCVDQDSDTFHSFRDHVLSDALDTCQKLLQRGYLEYFGRALQTASSWQAAEATLFALRLYHRESSSLAYSASSPSEDDEFLMDLFTQLASPDSRLRALRSQPHCVESALQLMGANTTWLASCPRPLLGAVVSYILEAMQHPTSAGAAASTLKFICMSTPQEQAGDLFSALLPTVLAISEGRGLEGTSWEERAEIVRGVTSLVGIARLSPAETQSASRRLALPFAERSEQLAKQKEDNAPPADALAGTLRMLATAIERMDFLVCEGATPEQQPAVVVSAASLPHLEAVSERDIARLAPDVTPALCQVLKNALQGLGSAGEPALHRILQILSRIFQGDPQACIQVLTTAVDVSQAWSAAQSDLGDTVAQLATAIAPSLQGRDANPELATAWFGLLAHCLLHDPRQQRRALTDRITAAVPTHFGLAIGMLDRQEDDLCRALLAFLRSALGLDDAEASGLAAACMQGHGKDLVRELLRAAAVSFPQRIMRSLASLVHSVINHASCGEAARTFFARCMAEDAVLSRALEAEDRERICRLALGLAPALAGSFGALLKDMASIARNELGSDVLLAYELQ